MKVIHVVGADISKESIDFAIHGSKDHLRIKNQLSGFSEFISWLKSKNIKPSSLRIVMEHTGYYSYQFEEFLFNCKVPFTKVAALAIKRSLGMIRGKTDKIDAQRIARYGYEKSDTLVDARKIDPKLERLKLLHTTRDALVKQRAALLASLKEFERFVQSSDLIITSRKSIIEACSEQIKKLDAEIQEVIQSSEELSKNYKLITSVVGIGPVVGTAMLIKTKNFTSFKNGRKFACYAGVAPFEHSSGTSIKGRTRVSHLADKEMKALLTQSAKSAVQHDPELKKYYKERISKGKPKGSTLNIIKNKLIHRVFAVSKRGTPYKRAERMAA